VQCPHCDELFIATAPTTSTNQTDDSSPVDPAESFVASDTETVATKNPAEDEPLPSTQERYQDAETVRQLLTELSRVTNPGEVALSDESGSYEARQLLSALPSDVLSARIVTRSADESGEYIQAQVSGFFKTKTVAYRIVWSSSRQGWACDWPGANTHHYFIPKAEMTDPPYSGDGMLVSLCKRAFCMSERPLHRNGEAKKCSICLERRGKMLGYDVPKKPKKKAQRITLTNGQTETLAGRRLLQLISQLADDHKLDATELQQFRESLNDSELQEFAATEWLKDSLDTVLADGYVTREEYYGVVASILRVLPTTIRDDWERRMRSSDRPATDRQVDYIENLGGKVTEGMSVKQASNLIDSLLKAQGRSSEDY
jgi:hypothetical protein